MTSTASEQDERRATAWRQAPVALLRLDPDGAVLDANELLLEWLGVGRDEVVGASRIGQLLTVGGRMFWETHVGPMLRLVGHVDEVAVELRCAGGRKPVLMSVRAGARVADPDDATRAPEPVLDVAMFAASQRARYEREIMVARDVAERVAERLQTLQAVSVALAPATDVDTLADALTETLVRQLGAAAVSLWLPDARGLPRRLGLRAAPTPRGSRSSGAPSTPDAADGSDAADAADASGAVSDPHTTPPPAADDLAVLADGTVVLALAPRPDLRGALVVTPSGSPADDPLDHDTLVAVARQTSVALDRAGLAEHSASVAHELQRAMLRGDLPEDPRLALESVYRPGVRTLEVGGDWYDAFWLADDSLAMVVGDVVGRGLDAATTMGQLRTAVRAVSAAGRDPDVVLDRLDAFVERTGTGFSASVAYAVLDLGTGRLRYACAGHLPPVLVGGAGVGHLLWGGRSTTLGVRSERHSGVAHLAPGDTLLLYTDGLVERRDRHLRDGLDALVGSASSWRDAGGAFDDTFVDELLRGSGENDDTCVLSATFRGGEAPVR